MGKMAKMWRKCCGRGNGEKKKGEVEKNKGEVDKNEKKRNTRRDVKHESKVRSGLGKEELKSKNRSGGRNKNGGTVKR